MKWNFGDFHVYMHKGPKGGNGENANAVRN